ncbi:MAG: glycosyltransferase, partial [Bryobacteraceae bacterium]
NAEDYLKICLRRIGESNTQPFEIIVVDDGSTDASLTVAKDFGAVVLSTEDRHGPARARNIGAKAAKGEILFFIDSDVCVLPDTISRLVWRYSENPNLDALIGSYDNSPGSRDFLSLYKNLMHCFVHQNAREEACTFWSGCGAIRRTVFLEHGGFDDSYRRPAIEDIELGYRLKAAGRTLQMDRQMQVKHLKRWTFTNLIVTDVMHRGIPWTELILRDRKMPNDLNVRVSERISVALVFILFFLALLGAVRYNGQFLVPVISLLLFVHARFWAETAAQPGTKTAFAVVSGLVGLFIWLCYTHGMMPMVPTVLVGYLLLFLRQQFASGSERPRKWTGLACAVYLVSGFLFTLTFLPARPIVFLFYILLLVVIILNNQFYVFLASRMGSLAAIAIIPFHILYHFYNGISFAIGVCLHVLRLASASFKTRPLPRTDHQP